MANTKISLLSELHDKEFHWNVCVLVSRLWHYRGATDDGPIIHTDLVVIDKEGTHMYAQIPADASPRLMQDLEEGKVFLFRKFLCNPSRPAFKAVDSPFMIQCTRYTTAVPQEGLEDGYPYCTYNLVPFPEIPKPGGKAPYFLDVIGQITAVSDVIPVQSMYQIQPSDTRTIVLQDLLGNEMKITLWGARACEFEAEQVYAAGETGAVIGIFVGVLPKMLQGVKSLSGSSACRWYIDEDLPDINSFRASLGEEIAPVAVYTSMNQGLDATRVREAPVELNVQQLLSLDPFENRNKPFVCTVSIGRLGSDQRWWFLSCGGCRKTAYVNGRQFRCSDRACDSIAAEPVYCVCTFATDGTAEAEFMFFEKVARVAVGKPLLTLLSQRYPGCSDINEFAQMAGSDHGVPMEVSRMVTKKYRLVVTISRKSIAPTSHQLSFQVSRIEHTFKPELGPLGFGHGAGSSGPASSGGSSVGGSLAMQSSSPLPPYTPSSKDVHGSGGTALAQSVIDELNTPIAAMKGKSASHSPTGKSPCPKSSRRKLLFISPVKGNEDAKVQTIVDSPLSTENVIITEVTATGSKLTDVDADASATAPAKTVDTAVAETTKLKRAAAVAAKNVLAKKLK